MRLLVQRVKHASVKKVKSGEVLGKIDRGLLVLIGISGDDTKKNAEVLADKLSSLRIMADKDGKINLSVRDIGAKILIVSQFTLYADTSEGNRPSFIKAAEPKTAEVLY